MALPADNIAAGVAVSNLLADYVSCIDADTLERWPGFFTETCIYKITTAYNIAHDLPIGIVYADNRKMLEDRIAALRNANVYEAQSYRHIVSAVRIVSREGLQVEAEASFLVIRIMADGTQDVFVTGRYIDRIDFEGEGPLFAEKIVVLDSDKIDTLLAIPI